MVLENLVYAEPRSSMHEAAALVQWLFFLFSCKLKVMASGLPRVELIDTRLTFWDRISLRDASSGKPALWPRLWASLLHWRPEAQVATWPESQDGRLSTCPEPSKKVRAFLFLSRQNTAWAGLSWTRTGPCAHP